MSLTGWNESSRTSVSVVLQLNPAISAGSAFAGALPTGSIDAHSSSGNTGRTSESTVAELSRSLM